MQLGQIIEDIMTPLPVRTRCLLRTLTSSDMPSSYLDRVTRNMSITGIQVSTGGLLPLRRNVKRGRGTEIELSQVTLIASSALPKDIRNKYLAPPRTIILGLVCSIEGLTPEIRNPVFMMIWTERADYCC